MLLDHVDDQDRAIGQVRRVDVFQAQANFRVVHVLLFDRAGRLLLQQIAPGHARHPGDWGSSVAGYVKAGESYEAAAERKLREELGLTDVPLRLLGKTSMVDEGSKKFISVFAATHEGGLRPNPEDFAAWEFVPLERLRAGRSRRLTPTFEHVLEYALPKLPVA